MPKLLGDLTTQTYRDFEVIVVDGHSDDATVTKAKAFIPQLPRLTVVNSPRRHVCTQRNLGAKHAQADIFIFMDADNRLPPYFLQGLKYRWESSDAEILSCWFKPDIPTPRNEVIATAINTFFELQNNLKPRYMLETLFSIQKHCFMQIGGFDESVNYAEGKSMIQSATLQGFRAKIVHDPVYIYSFRRFRKFGVIKMASNLAKLELAELFGSEFHNIQAKQLYPMLGGNIFKQSKKARSQFLRKITQLLQDF